MVISVKEVSSQFLGVEYVETSLPFFTAVDVGFISPIQLIRSKFVAVRRQKLVSFPTVRVELIIYHCRHLFQILCGLLYPSFDFFAWVGHVVIFQSLNVFEKSFFCR